MIKQDKMLLLLGILRSHQSHVYELHALLSSPLAPIAIGKANAYQILNQFEENGWVTATEEREGNRPTRRVYTLTPVGEEVFQKLLRERLTAHTPAVHADAVSLNFLDLLPPEESVTLLSVRLDAVQRRLDEIREQTSEGTDGHYGVEYLLNYMQFERDWLQELIGRLNAQVQEPGSH